MSDDEDNVDPLKGFWLEGDSLAPPCQCEMDVASTIVGLAAPYLKHDNSLFLYDLGCGDGRICLEATRVLGCNSLGCEIEEPLVEKFQASIARLGLESKVTAVLGDLRQLDLSRAKVITIYLLPESIEQIKGELFKALENDSVLIFNTWGLKSLTPKIKTACGFSDNVTLLLYDKSCL